MPWTYFTIAVDNYNRPIYEVFVYFLCKNSLCSNDPYSCNPYMQDVVMKFKVHKVKELYFDLQKYDLRGELREFSIVRPAITVKFATFTEALRWHGYIRDVEVYYLNPAPWSEPSTGLVKIVGPGRGKSNGACSCSRGD